MTAPHKPKSTEVGYRRFSAEVDMESLQSFLLEDPEMEGFAKALQDPGYSKLSFVVLCRKFSIPLSKLQEIYTNGMRHLGLIRMSTALPEVMAGVAEDAKSRDVPCPRCDGRLVIKTGIDGETRPCHVCHERGTVRVAGDKHARDLVFESMKLTNQNGPLVAIQQNFRSADDDNMASMFKKTQVITVGKAEESE